jgi:hypothetical protein
MSIKKAIIRAQVNDVGLYSKAEDVAEKMRQTKGRGDDFKRYFMKQGVKAEELEALGLNDLFRQERVTQQEILDRIESNRIEMQETVSTGPAEGSYDFEYDEEDIDIEEAYGSDYQRERAEELLFDALDAFLPTHAIDDYARRYSNDQDEFLELQALMESVVNGETDFDKLPRAIRNDLLYEAENEVILEYERDPIRRITVQFTDENAETQNIGDMPGAAFSYSLVGNEDMGFALDGRERNSVPDNILRQLDNARIFDPDEVVVQLRGIAEEYGDIEGLAQGETRWGEYTLDGGENYQEARLSLPSKGKERFREGVHFPDDINNVFHIRTKDREGPMGEKILYVEEVQSDWAQQGRKQGFRSPEVEKQAQEAARQLLEETRPLLDELTLNDNVRNRPAEGTGFASTLTELLDAGGQERLARIDVLSNEFIEADERDKFIEYQRSSALDAAGNIKAALQGAEQRAKRAASRILDQEYLDGFTQEQKLEALTNSIIETRHGVDLPVMELDLIRRNVRSEVEQMLEERPGRVDQMILDQARKRGELPPDSNLSFEREFDGTNPKFEAALVQAKKEQRDYLAGLGVDPMLYSKLQSALDKADPEGAKLKAEKMQRDKADVGPFVLDTQSWNKLAIKYIFKKAAEEGYDGVSFAPADAHVDRWGDEGLRVQYDENIPRAIDKVFGKAPIIPSNRPETMEVDGYESQIYHLDNLTRDGESIYEKMKDPTTMFGFAPLPLMLPQGIAGLQGLSPEQAEEQERKVRELERTFPDAMPSESAGILGALKGAGEVAYEGLSDLVIEPFMGMSGAEAAFEMGATPEEAEEARRRAAAMVDFETSSPTGKRYKEAVKGGLGALGEYLMGEGEMGRTRSGMPIAPSRDPAQFLFQEALVPAAEAVTEGALGIIGLDPRDTAEMERVRQEAARPFIEAIQPI